MAMLQSLIKNRRSNKDQKNDTDKEEQKTTSTLSLRCNRCMRLLQVPLNEVGKKGTCPKCKNDFTIPGITNKKKRKGTRAIIGESELAINPPELLTKSDGKEFCKVVYSQADPIEFLLKRENVMPTLDISDGGISFLVKADEQGMKLKTKKYIWLEIDFPILTMPIYTQIQVKWAKPSVDKKTIRIGGMFLYRDDSVRKIIQTLVKYVMMRPTKWNSV